MPVLFSSEPVPEHFVVGWFYIFKKIWRQYSDPDLSIRFVIDLLVPVVFFLNIFLVKSFILWHPYVDLINCL